MKTAEEFYKELVGSSKLREEIKALSEEALGAFLKKHGCGASAKDFAKYVKSLEQNEIPDKDAEAVAGGIPLFDIYAEGERK